METHERVSNVVSDAFPQPDFKGWDDRLRIVLLTALENLCSLVL
jgi:hypothetical protein